MNFVGIQKQVRISHGKQAFGVRTIEVQLNIEISQLISDKKSLEAFYIDI